MPKSRYDAIVVGAGPNGLAAAITMQRAGLSVLLIEGSEQLGGGVRSKELTLPGFVHDVCSTVYPFARLSPFFQNLPLAAHGLKLIDPIFAAAHPLDDGTSGILTQSFAETVERLGRDGKAYQRLMNEFVNNMPDLIPDVLSDFPSFHYPLALASFGIRAFTSAAYISKRFETAQGKALLAGMAAHSMQPLNKPLTTGIAMTLMGAAHHANWPIVEGGAQNLTNALVSYFQSIGGEIQTGYFVKDINKLPDSKALLLDITPRQLIQMTGDTLTDSYIARLRKYRYGMGVFKIDWALSEPIPFTNSDCRMAGTIHIGNTFEEIARSEHQAFNGAHSEKPFVLLSQPTVFDKTRAPENQHVAWGYCHVPAGSGRDQTLVVENQVERFAPGFKDTILARHAMSATEMESYNPNYVGGDINGGVQDIWQHFSRPILSMSPYRTSTKGIYLCSSSTPPGGGVHGMCGYLASQRALKDLF